jgi:hypothetical protein
MNKENEILAEKILQFHRENNSVVNIDQLTSFANFKDTKVKQEIMFTLFEFKLLEYVGEDRYRTRLTNKGWHFPGFEKYREEEQNKKTTQDTINILTIKQLKGNIFQIKFWWLPLLISGIIGFIAGNFDWLLSKIAALIK